MCWKLPFRCSAYSTAHTRDQRKVSRGTCALIFAVITLLQDGWTPLHIAAQHGHVEVERLLLDKGANKEAASNVGAVRPLMCLS